MNDSERDKLTQKILRKLLAKRVIESNPASIEEISNWFVEDEVDKVREIIYQSESNPEVPIELVNKRGEEMTYISDVNQAFEQIDREIS